MPFIFSINCAQQSTAMATSRKDIEKKGKLAKKDEQQISKDLGEEKMAAVLAELRTLRKEHTEASKDTKDSLTRVESALGKVVERMIKLEQWTTEYKQRLSDTEDKMK